MHQRSDAPPVYHGRGIITRLMARLRRRPEVPRLFALVREDDGDGTEFVAWGMALPDGRAVTFGRGNVGQWSGPASAARLMFADLRWL
ncbi:hypothetical protein [Actinoallomurus rhizosphaericola]|uniref:hypothetical protein n=1 Tax=Actinoallomurus rhizosphaericola TaxID=2952536 RepID=UPI0020934EF3|nr:hypothetical protein [Actinoallomurus rhizosphaericola]MCO5996838.1 hypothetical protein [Actinoallomurus rhizosphaericola]